MIERFNETKVSKKKIFYIHLQTEKQKNHE